MKDEDVNDVKKNEFGKITKCEKRLKRSSNHIIIQRKS